MAKIPKINKKPKKTLQPESVKTSTKAKMTQNVAFVVPAVKLQLLMSELLSPINALIGVLKDEGISLSDMQNTIEKIVEKGPLELHLTGLQFSFDDDDEGIKIVNIYQVYYLRNKDVFVRYQTPSTSIVISELSQNHKRTIVQHEAFSVHFQVLGESSEISHSLQLAEDSETDSSLDFRNLDFIQEHTGEPVSFVYFAIDQIKPLIARTALTDGDIILSGSRLDLGRKLSDNGEGHKYEGLYFSLKMEGKLGSGASKALLKKGGTNPDTVETTFAPGIAVSFPCPPTWYYLSNLFQIAKQVNPDANYHRIKVRQVVIPNDLFYTTIKSDPVPAKPGKGNT